MSKSSVWHRDHNIVSEDESPSPNKLNKKPSKPNSSVKNKNKPSESKNHRKSRKILQPPKSDNPYIGLKSGIGITATEQDKKEAKEAEETFKRLNEQVQLARLQLSKNELEKKRLIGGKSKRKSHKKSRKSRKSKK